MIAVVAELSAYFDDSGTHDVSPVVVLGGLLGTEDQWIAFEAAWAALLAAPLPGKPPLRQFHLAPCRAAAGEFADYNRADRDRITYLFRQIILDVGLVTIASALNKTAWNELVTGDLVAELGEPIAYCFVKCVDQILNTVRLRKPGQRVAIVFDQGTKRDLEQWMKFYVSQSGKYPEIAALGFGRVSEILPLQGADMIATETYQFSQQWLKDGENAIANAHFRDYLKRELSSGLMADREHVEQIVARVRETQRLLG
jgi:hypothetical protein